MDLSLHLRLVGASLLLLATAHIYFARRFEWRRDSEKLTPLNRQIFLVHAFFICLTLMLMGILTLVFPSALIAPTPLARLILIGFVVFWGVRLVFQWLVYDASHWQGNRVRTMFHLLFTILWAYYTAVFAVAWWVNSRGAG